VFKGFREFILRGNIVDLAVAVVIGTAFADLVMQFNQSFLTPLVAVFTGGGDVGGRFVVLGQTFGYGAFVGAVITFLITAAVVYLFVVVPTNKLISRFSDTHPEKEAQTLVRKAKMPERDTDASASETQLLTEIRDLLRPSTALSRECVTVF
jgi:large conductance mechanosensitive channel